MFWRRIYAVVFVYIIVKVYYGDFLFNYFGELLKSFFYVKIIIIVKFTLFENKQIEIPRRNFTAPEWYDRCNVHFSIFGNARITQKMNEKKGVRRT